MDLHELRRLIIEPSLLLLPLEMESPQAIAMMLAVGLQESNFVYRRNMNDGKRRGFWRMEKGRAVHTILCSPTWAKLTRRACVMRDTEPTDQAVWEAIEFDDVLAACMARLLLATISFQPPTFGDERGSWFWYLYAWRPGSYIRGDVTARTELRSRWMQNYPAALKAAR